MDEPRDSLAGRDGLARSDPMSDPRQQMDDRSPGWVLPAVLATVVIAGAVAFAMSRDRQTAGTAPDTTTGQSTQAPAPKAPALRP